MEIDLFKITLVLCTVASILVLAPFFTAIVMAMVFAYLLTPLAERLEKVTKHRKVSIVLSMLIVAIPVLSFGLFTLSTTFGLIVKHSTYFLSKVNEILFNLMENYGLGQYSNLIMENTDKLSSVITNNFIDISVQIPLLLLQLFLFVVATYYFIDDGWKLKKYAEERVLHDSRLKLLFEDMDRIFNAIFVTHFLTAVVITIFAGILYFALGLPYAAFLTIITLFAALIPKVGPFVVYVPLSIFLFIEGDSTGATITLLYGLFFLSLIDDLIRARIMSGRAYIHPLILLLGFAGGPLFFGISGFIVGPALLGFTKAFYDVYLKSPQIKEEQKEINKSD